jgi:hypothetical protein
MFEKQEQAFALWLSEACIFQIVLKIENISLKMNTKHKRGNAQPAIESVRHIGKRETEFVGKVITISTFLC